MWGWLNLLMFAGTTWAMGARWPIALAAAPLWLLWPPAAYDRSLGQTTAVWLLCAALAYRWRDRPWLAGALMASPRYQSCCPPCF